MNDRSAARLARLLALTLAAAAPLVVAAAPAYAQAPATDTTTATDTDAGAESAIEREARDYLLRGNALAVVQLFERTLQSRAAPGPAGKGKPLAVEAAAWPAGEATALAEGLVGLGRYEAARQLLAPLVLGKRATPQAVLLLAEVERQAGSTQARQKLLSKALTRWPGHAQLIVAFGEQLYEAGNAVAARKILDPLADRYQAEQFRETADLVAVARSLELNGYPRDANTVYEEAAEAATTDAERKLAELHWGLLFVSKYNYRDGDKSFRKVLAIDPHAALAHLGQARIDLASDHAVAQARKRIDAVLARNPKHLDALVMRAEIALYDEDLDAARTYLQQAAAQRADAPQVLHVRGALCKLADDAACWTATEKAALRVNPDDGRLYLTAATYLEMAHRYREVLELLQTALEREPSLWQAHAALGMGYARVADDAKARKHLQTAYSGDPFDVRTANQLSVLYEGVLKHMVLLPGKAVDLRVHRSERKALERTVLPFLQQSVAQLSDKYGFAPARPLQVEIFPSTEHFSVRTVGLPALGAHAVCFGHLITSRSPVGQPFNWKMVLHHELAHVFHIQASDGRVPRWLTEGLAMMESAWADPRWKMVMDRRAYERLQAGELAAVARFNLAFSQAQSMQEIIDAYYQAMLLVEHLQQRYGFDKLRDLVAGHKSGKPTVALVREHFGVEPAVLDQQFADWLRKKLARYDKDFRPQVAQVARELGLATPAAALRPEPEPGPEPEAEPGPEPEPEPGPEPETEPEPGREPKPDAVQVPAERAGLAEAVRLLRASRHGRAFQVMTARVAAAAKTPTDKATEQQRKDLCTLRFWLMELALQRGDRKTAAEQAGKLAAEPGGSCDGVRQRLVLAADAKANQQLPRVVEHLRAARRLDPTDGQAGMLWLEAAAEAAQAVRGEGGGREWLQALVPSGDPAELRGLVRELLDLDANDPRPAALLARLAWAQWPTAEGPAKAKAVADLALGAQVLEETIPASRDAVLFEARAQVAAGKAMAALPIYRLAAERAETAAQRAEVWCELVEVADKAGAREDAAEARRRCAADRPVAPSPAAKTGSATAPVERSVPKPL